MALPTFKTGFTEYKEQFPTGNQSVDSGTEQPAEIASPKVEANITEDTTTPNIPPTTGDFRVPTDEVVSTNELDTTVDDVFAERDKLYNDMQLEEDRVRNERDLLRNTILSGMRTLTGKSARQLQLEAESGIEGDTAEIANLRKDIADINAQMESEMARTDLGVTQRSIIGEQARIENRYLREIGAKSAMILVLEGNIEAAQSLAERTVNMEYAPLENELAIKLKELEFKDEDLTDAEADAKAEIESNLAAITAKKEDRKEIKNFALELWKSGAKPEDVMAAMYAGSIEEAIAYAPKQMQGELTSSLTEYKFAQEQGYAGSFLEFQRTLANLKVTASTSADKLLSVTEAKTLGVPYGTTENEAIQMGITPTKDPTEAQGLTAGYALRMDQSDPTITKLTQNVLGYDSAEYALYKKMSLTNVFNPEIPSDLQSVFQAQRNFLNAVLRKESGAVISPTEFDEGAKQYFPVPGDSPEVLKQKEQTRKQAIIAFKSSAGAAYDDLVVDFGEVRSLEGYVAANPNELQAVEALLTENPDLTDDEVLQILNGK